MPHLLCQAQQANWVWIFSVFHYPCYHLATFATILSNYNWTMVHSNSANVWFLTIIKCWLNSRVLRTIGITSISLTAPAPMIFSAAYTDLLQRGHISEPPNFWANLDVFWLLVGWCGRSLKTRKFKPEDVQGYRAKLSDWQEWAIIFKQTAHTSCLIPRDSPLSMLSVPAPAPYPYPFGPYFLL